MELAAKWKVEWYWLSERSKEQAHIKLKGFQPFLFAASHDPRAAVDRHTLRETPSRSSVVAGPRTPEAESGYL
jgi:hypothetical protein